MDIKALLAGIAKQQGAGVIGDGSQGGLQMTRAGQLFVADWKTRLVLAGFAFNLTVGTAGGEGDITLITGGGDGTTVDGDQPEMAVGTPPGYYHIPLGFTCSVQGDSNANADVANIVLAADLTQQIPLPVAASSTVETPQNLLDGGPASVSWAQSAVTTDITNPVASVLLAFATNYHAQITAASAVIQSLNLDYDPSFPSLFAGPCSVCAWWGGTCAQDGMASYNWAEVPESWFK